MKKKTVLITGGAGFIGSHTADALAAKGYRVRILDSLAPPVHTGEWPDYVRDKGFELIKGDVRSAADWKRALRGIDAVFHLAAFQDQLPEFSTFFATNTLSTAMLYEQIVADQLPIRKVVLASTQFVYGDGEWRCAHKKQSFFPELRETSQFEKKAWEIRCPHGKQARFQPFREEQRPNPTNSYGLSKVALEQLAMRLGKTYDIPSVALRYSIVQGPRQSPRNMYSGALRIFTMQALAGDPITVYEDGDQLRDFVNVKDVVRANLLALENRRADFEIFNVGGGKGVRVRDFGAMVKRITKSMSPIAIRGEYRKTDTRHAVSDTKKLEGLGWKARHTPEKSIADYAAWFQASGFDARAIRGAQAELQRLGVVSR